MENKRIDATVNEGASDVWDKIVGELQAGEDVELVIDFKESMNGALKNSHSVTVVGASSKGNNHYITVHDSLNGPSNDTYRVRRDGVIEGHPLGKGFGTFLISESFKGNS